jgi:hypothetical protein
MSRFIFQKCKYIFPLTSFTNVCNNVAMREKYLKKLKADVRRKSIYNMAYILDITYITLWRIVNDKSPGSVKVWDKIYRHYGL